MRRKKVLEKYSKHVPECSNAQQIASKLYSIFHKPYTFTFKLNKLKEKPKYRNSQDFLLH